MSPGLPSLKLLSLIALAGGLGGAGAWYLADKLGAGLILSLILGGAVALGLPAGWGAWLWKRQLGR